MRVNNASLDVASLDAASLDNASLDDASLDAASLDNAALDDASFDDASLDVKSFDNSFLAIDGIVCLLVVRPNHVRLHTLHYSVKYSMYVCFFRYASKRNFGRRCWSFSLLLVAN